MPNNSFKPNTNRYALGVGDSGAMPQDQDHHSLHVPLFEALRAVGFGEHGNPHHFEIGTLFWSLARLFGHYERIVTALDEPFNQRAFLESDIESFIVRFRIVLNDIAFVTWQLLPANSRGLKGPRGGAHPKNKEVSFFSLSEYLESASVLYPELAAAYATTASWANHLKDQRDNVVHYKSKALVFNSTPPSFALVSAGGTERTEATPNGGQKLVLTPVMGLVNGHLLALHNFMHSELQSAVLAHARRAGMKLLAVGSNERIFCTGIATFKRINALGA